MSEIRGMIGKEVIVTANGVHYTGVLIEVSDAEVHLKGAFQWITLPTSSVVEINLNKAVTKTHLPNTEEA